MEHNLPVVGRYSVIVRTEGYHAGTEEIEKELLELDAEYQRIIELAETRQKYYLLKLAEMPVLRFVKSGIEQERECEIVTDDEKIYKYLFEQKIHELYQGCSPGYSIISGKAATCPKPAFCAHWPPAV